MENVQRFALMAMQECDNLTRAELAQKEMHIQTRRYTPTIHESSWRLAEDVFIRSHRPI